MSLEIKSLFGLGAWRTPPTASRRRFGVPPGGPWITEAAQLALALVGKRKSEPVFELLQGSITLLAQASGSIAVIGGTGRARVGDSIYPLNSRFGIRAGQVLQIDAHYAYIAYASEDFPAVKIDFEVPTVKVLRFLANGQAPSLTILTVDRASNRAGIRLNGLPRSCKLPEQPSEPCCVGTIQQTPSGQLIIIGPDGPTIGGYPKLGTIIEADIHLCAILLPLQEVKLVQASWPDAMTAGINLVATAKSKLANLSVSQVLPGFPAQLP